MRREISFRRQNYLGNKVITGAFNSSDIDWKLKLKLFHKHYEGYFYRSNTKSPNQNALVDLVIYNNTEFMSIKHVRENLDNSYLSVIMFDMIYRKERQPLQH